MYIGPYGGLLRILSCHSPISRGLESFFKAFCEHQGIALLCEFRDSGSGPINDPKELLYLTIGT